MKADLSPPALRRLSSPNRSRLRAAKGMTLVEVAFAVGLFAIMAMGAISALLQVRRSSEDDMSHVMADMVAQGIIEEVERLDWTSLNDSTATSIPVKFVAANSSNLVDIQSFNIPWATDTTTFTPVGAVNGVGTVLGVLVDMDYRNGATVIRPARYEKLSVNLQRTTSSNGTMVEIILTYTWEVAKRGTRTPSITREIRTVRSGAQSF